MNSIVYVGMDVHKESYTLCCYCYDTDKVEYKQTIPSDYKLILKYMESMRKVYGEDATFVCGYEAGCLGYSLYHQLQDHAVDCKILAPTTMAITNISRVKTDKRDAANIAKTVKAGQKYIKAIQKLIETELLYDMPEDIQELAQLKLENPELSLDALGKLCSEPMTKSSVNRRLQKLCSIAQIEE